MTATGIDGGREARFRELFELAEREILAYALRRVRRPEDAADIVAETFLVAWRRLDEVPSGERARLWLYGTARRALANQRRGELRRSRLAERLRAELSGAVAPTPEAGGAVRAALARLDERDREVLALSHWEELAPAQIAVVLGIPAVTIRSRLHRARGRLRRELARDGGAPAPPPRPASILERTES